MAKQAGAAGSTDHVIFPTEAEAYVQELQPFPISDVGSQRWSLQRERMEQLNMQACLNETQQKNEFVKEFLCSHEKFPVLIHELLAAEIWKEQVFPRMIKCCQHPKSSFPAYLVLYHEGTVASLLETALYYRESCECAEDAILDLVDYCYRKITHLLAETAKRGRGVKEVEDGGEDSDASSDRDEHTPSKNEIVKELCEQKQSLEFSIGIKALSIIRYITDHLPVLPLSVMTRILNTHDVPCLLVDVFEASPWSRTTDKGKLEKYEDGEGREVGAGEQFRLAKTEGQVWLCLCQLLMSPDCQKKYQFNQHNKNMLLKLRRYLTEPVLDQIPNLVDLQRYLQHLSLMDPPMARSELILEQVPAIYEQLQKDNSTNWSSIARSHAKLLLEPSAEEMKLQAKRWVDSYNLDILETLVDGPPKCARCGEEASKRCSRCRNEWYCGRECQVKHWKSHKVSCDVISANS